MSRRHCLLVEQLDELPKLVSPPIKIIFQSKPDFFGVFSKILNFKLIFDNFAPRGNDQNFLSIIFFGKKLLENAIKLVSPPIKIFFNKNLFFRFFLKIFNFKHIFDNFAPGVNDQNFWSISFFEKEF